MFTIRRTLIGLFVLLGLGLCVLVTLQAWVTFLQYRDVRELTVSNLAREQLSRAAMAVAEERTAAYLSLLGAPDVESNAAGLRSATDAIFEKAAETLVRMDGGSETVLERLRQALASLRENSDAQRALEGMPIREASGPAVFTSYSQLVEELVTLRISLLVQEHPADAGTANAFLLRRYTTILIESLMQNEALVGGLLARRTPEAERIARDQIRGNVERAEVASELLENRLGNSEQGIGLELVSLETAYQERYRPLEQELLTALSDPAPAEEGVRSAAVRMLERMQEIKRTGAEFQESLFAYSRDRLAVQQRRAARLALLWASLFVVGLATVAGGTRVVVRRVVEPLEHLRQSMLLLASGNSQAPLPEHGRADEIGAMADALRVFRVNAIRQSRLQEERLALYEKLHGAHRRLQQDLEAASAVQLSLLPEPARLGGVRFTGRLKPSHFVSGDTYDVLRQPNGPVHFFLADVAGHGAAAALVSVASRYAAAQSILQRQAGDSLSGAMTTLNEGWPEHLPYFTVIMGELHPETGRGALVQAGHPPPVLLRRSGAVEMIGDGGLPIGVIRGASFDEVAFDFKRGDRLLVYSDGLSEAEDHSGRPFTEERLLDLLRANRHLPTETLLGTVTGAVQDWRGSEAMEDDMTLLVLEAADGGEHTA